MLARWFLVLGSWFRGRGTGAEACSRHSSFVIRHLPQVIWHLEFAPGVRYDAVIMKVNLAYGEGVLPIELRKNQTTVIEPSHTAACQDERAAVLRALENPIGAPPLRLVIRPEDKIC